MQALLARLAGDSGTPPAAQGMPATQDASAAQREGSAGGGPSPAARFGSGGFQPAPPSSGFQPLATSGFQQPAASAFQSPPASGAQLPQVLLILLHFMLCTVYQALLSQHTLCFSLQC